MTLAKEIHRLAHNLNGPFKEGIQSANTLIPKAGRFVVDQTVMGAVGRMERTPLEQLITAIENAKTPFPITWIEWPNSSGGRIGYLIEQKNGETGFCFRQYLQLPRSIPALNTSVVCTIGKIYVQAKGIDCDNDADRSDHERGFETAARDLLALLLMINSPSKVVTFGDVVDSTAVDRKREKSGKPPLPNLRPIWLDVNRLSRMDKDHKVDGANGKVREEHFVRGHFKWRNNRMFWWSPHLRNKDLGEAVPREYQVVYD